MITYSDDDSLDVIYEKLRRKRLSPSYYLQCIERFVEVGDVVDIEIEGIGVLRNTMR